MRRRRGRRATVSLPLERSAPNPEPGGAARWRDLLDRHIVHAGAARSAPERGFDPPHRVRIAFDERFDRAIAQVPDVARDPLVASGVLDEVPEPDSLHPARDQIAPGNEHAPPLTYAAALHLGSKPQPKSSPATPVAHSPRA